ncbi:hypothetical protein [Embleya sp. AB8]|uniref:hypothetical protein n=1 Tax=Embleya sp. AB8 TaxID=3156304 RepID=UPI003C71DC86
MKAKSVSTLLAATAAAVLTVPAVAVAAPPTAAAATEVSVPCDPARLSDAIRTADTHPDTTLTLAKDCTYRLTVPLPTITANMTINGSGATLAREDRGTPTFRVLHDDGAAVALSDLTVTGGRIEAGANGGGILVSGGGALTLTRVLVKWNFAGPGIPGAAGGSGGGIYIGPGGSLTATDTRVLENRSGAGGVQVGANLAGHGGDGGGIAMDAGTLTLVRSTVSGNHAEYGGPGDAATAPAASLPNEGGNGGGIAARQASRTTLLHSTICNNTAGGGGWAGPLKGGPGGYGGNGARGGRGGGLELESGSAQLTETSVCLNVAGDGGAGGPGDLHWGFAGGSNDGGGIDSTANLVITGGTISGNRTGTNPTQDSDGADGGGIRFTRSALTITGATISGNQSAGDGGGVSQSTYRNGGEAHFAITSTTITGNGSGHNGGGISIRGYGPRLDRFDPDDSTLTTSTVTGNSAAGDCGGISLTRNGVGLQRDHDTVARNHPDDC